MGELTRIGAGLVWEGEGVEFRVTLGDLVRANWVYVIGHSLTGFMMGLGSFTLFTVYWPYALATLLMCIVLKHLFENRMVKFDAKDLAMLRVLGEEWVVAVGPYREGRIYAPSSKVALRFSAEYLEVVSAEGRYRVVKGEGVEVEGEQEPVGGLLWVPQVRSVLRIREGDHVVEFRSRDQGRMVLAGYASGFLERG